MEFQDVIASQPAEVEDEAESRFSFFQGGYVEDFKLQGIFRYLEVSKNLL